MERLRETAGLPGDCFCAAEADRDMSAVIGTPVGYVGGTRPTPINRDVRVSYETLPQAFRHLQDPTTLNA